MIIELMAGCGRNYHDLVAALTYKGKHDSQDRRVIINDASENMINSAIFIN